MKILFTSAHPGLFKKGLEWLVTSEISTRALIDITTTEGHQITFRPVALGEKLDEFDLVIVEQSAATRTWGSGHLLGCLWCFAQNDVPAVAQYLHWDLRTTQKNYAYFMDHLSQLWDGFIRYRGQELAEKYHLQLEESLYRLYHGTIPSMITAHPWGDHSLLTTGTALPGFDFVHDPSILMFGPPALVQTDREKKWVYATCERTLSWVNRQKLTWPMDLHGLRRHKREWIALTDLMVKYSSSWGTLSPPYYTAGSGYWRNRLVHYAQQRCITLLDERDSQTMGEAYRLSSAQIETMSPQELATTAEEQAQWMFDNIENEETLRARVLAFLEEQRQ
jgi:hypothetical protein